MHRKRTLLFGTAVAVAAGVAAGCGGGTNGSQSEAASTSGNPQSSSPAKTITVKETEFKLTPSTVSVAKTGTYAIKVVNTGSITHALEVEGNGVEEKSGDVGAGSSTTFTVALKSSGKYEMYCPIDGHRKQGMEGTITVGSAAGGGMRTGTSTTQTNTGGGGYGGY
jgi:plastocyanin